MKLQSKTLIILLLLPALLLANNKFGGKYTKEKTVKKEFSVNKDAMLMVDNSYGNIDVTTWNENRTVIEVHIITNSNDEEKAQKKLDQITIDFEGSASVVSAKTIFNKKKSTWSIWGNNNNVSMEINYSIKLPVTNSVDLENDYGAISLDRLDGNAKINCDYGQLHIGDLNGESNYLNFDYTSKSTIDYMKNGKINADYSGFTLEKADQLELNADYTHSEIMEIDGLAYNCDYGKVVVNKVGNLTGRGDYVTNRIGSVSGQLNLSTNYGSIKVERLTEKAKDVFINGDYTGIKLGFANGYSFDFDVDLSYASFKGKESVTVTKSTKKNSSSQYSGYHGSEGSGNSITINSDYGGVTFYKN